MKFLEMTKARFEELNTVLCLGFDPVLEKLPFKEDTVQKTLEKFFFSLLEEFNKKVLAVKPNIAFYEQYGLEGIDALKNIIKEAKKYKVPVILDAKRGDIGNTSRAYAKAGFEDLGADALTLAPYMGIDSLEPFFDYKDKGIFILARTSNSGSSDFQLLKLEDGRYLYQEVISKIVEWNNSFDSNIGAVAGATHLGELEEIATFFSKNNYPPLLIPGVGKQGGKFKDVINVLNKVNYPLHNIFINSSSKILYAHQEHKDLTYIEASALEIDKMML